MKQTRFFMQGYFGILLLAALSFSGRVIAADATVVPAGFLAYPPYNGFVYESVHLLPSRQDHLIVVETEDDALSRGMMAARDSKVGSYGNAAEEDAQQRKAREKLLRLVAVPDQYLSEVKAMQAASSGAVAYSMGEHLPEAIRLYTSAAVDFRIAHPVVVVRMPDGASTPSLAPGALDTEQRKALDEAIFRFQAVLELSNAAKASRAVPAAYMLGRSYVLRGSPGDDALAEKAFVLTRTLARAGLPDPDGLAVASFGEQARLRRAAGDLSSTVGLYAEQATRGSVEGVESLKWVAQALYVDPDGTSKVENIPLAQRLLFAYALEYNDDGRVHDYTYAPGGHAAVNLDDGTMDLIVRTARQWPRAKIAWPDRLAALAYRTGDFDFARELIDGQDTALAWWLKAKMRVAEGKLEEAEADYRKVLAKSPNPADPYGLSPFNESAACSEMTQLEKLRGEVIAATRDLLDCDKNLQIGQPHDLTFAFADDVLSIAELQHIVATIPALTTSTKGHATSFQEEILRSELARRLFREKRYQEALTYADSVTNVSVGRGGRSFDTGLGDSIKTQRDIFQAYVHAKDQVQHAGSEIAKAAAWYRLALLIRIDHESIPDNDNLSKSDKATAKLSDISSSEPTRLKENGTVPDQGDLHWYIAFDYATEAAKLVPAHSQAYAAILCHAARWMHQAPPQSIDGRQPLVELHRAWRLYVEQGPYVPWADDFGHHCEDPDFVAAGRPVWWHEFTRLASQLPMHPLILGCLAFLLFAIVALLIMRRLHARGR